MNARGVAVYLAIAACLAFNWTGYAYFALTKDLQRKRRWFPLYLHMTAALFLLIAVMAGAFWAAVVLLPLVVLIDWMWIRQTRFRPRCGTIHAARGWFGPAKRCRRCGTALGPEDGPAPG